MARHLKWSPTWVLEVTLVANLTFRRGGQVSGTAAASGRATTHLHNDVSPALLHVFLVRNRGVLGRGAVDGALSLLLGRDIETDFVVGGFGAFAAHF